MNVTSNSNVSFETSFRLIDFENFTNKTQRLNPKKYEIAYPWTPNTMKKGKKLFTTGIMECITGGIIDGNKISGFHLGIRNQANARKTRQKGFDIKDFERRLLEMINTKSENIHGFILGGFHIGQGCINNFKTLQKIKEIFIKNDIPISVIGARRDVHHFGKFSWLYDSKNDTVYITNSLSKLDKSKTKNQQTMIIDGKKVHYNFYQQTYGKYGIDYKKIRKSENLEHYLKDEFEEVLLSNCDKFY